MHVALSTMALPLLLPLLLQPLLLMAMVRPVDTTYTPGVLFTKRYSDAYPPPTTFGLQQYSCGGKDQPACSLTRCAVACLQLGECRSLSYIKASGAGGTCRLYNILASDTTALSTKITAQGWVTYEMKTLDPDLSLPRDCTDIAEADSNAAQGVYTIYPTGQPLNVFCGFENGRLWTVIGRRPDSTVSFQRPLSDFVNGFGLPRSSQWIGLDVISALTSSGNYELKVVMKTSDNTLQEAVYSDFRVGGGPDYTLQYTRFLFGSAGDGLHNFRGNHFGGRTGCSGCLGWWVDSSGCCSNTPHHALNDQATWVASLSASSLPLVKFRMLIRRV